MFRGVEILSQLPDILTNFHQFVYNSVSIQRLIHSALDSGALDNIQSKPLKTTPTKRKTIHRTRSKAERHYKKLVIIL